MPPSTIYSDTAERPKNCFAFLTFTLTPAKGQLLVDAEVPTEAAPTWSLTGIAEGANAQR